MSQLRIIPNHTRCGNFTQYLVCNSNSEKATPFAMFVLDLVKLEITFHQRLEAPKAAAKYAYETATTAEEREIALFNIDNTPVDEYVIPIERGTLINAVTAKEMLRQVQEERAAKYEYCLVPYHIDRAMSVERKANSYKARAAQKELKAMQDICKSR
jgi:hypothetical protein